MSAAARFVALALVSRMMTALAVRTDIFYSHIRQINAETLVLQVITKIPQIIPAWSAILLVCNAQDRQTPNVLSVVQESIYNLLPHLLAAMLVHRDISRILSPIYAISVELLKIVAIYVLVIHTLMKFPTVVSHAILLVQYALDHHQ